MTAEGKTLGEQMTTWQIGESTTELTLDGSGRGEVTFTVTNTGAAQDRAVLTVTPLDGAADDWFTVEEPQRAVAPGASVEYPVMMITRRSALRPFPSRMTLSPSIPGILRSTISRL